MKELSIEEKAQAYDEALEKANALHKDEDRHLKATLERIFPELADESEDEKIRKVLVEIVKCNERSGYTLLNNVSTSSMLAWLEKQGERKYNWNEEDKHRIELLEALCEDKLFESVPNSTMYEEMKITIDWLKSLKDCVQPKQEWGEEDKEHVESILERLEGMCKKGATFTTTRFAVNQDIDWLKSLRPQKCLIPSEEEIEKAADEWDSKANFSPFYMTMNGGKPNGVVQDITTHKKSFKAGINWILKFLRLQNRWKPSKEQMSQLKWIAHQNVDNMIGKELITLYEDLKKEYKL